MCKESRYVIFNPLSANPPKLLSKTRKYSISTPTENIKPVIF